MVPSRPVPFVLLLFLSVSKNCSSNIDDDSNNKNVANIVVVIDDVGQ